MWNRTSRQRGPETRPETRGAHTGTERGSSNKGDCGSRGTAPHKHTHQKTHESRQHTRRAASFTAFLSPLLILRRLYSQGWLCRSAEVPCAVDVHVDVDVNVAMGARAATCTITDSEARHSTELTRRKRGFGRWVKLKTPRGKSSPVRVTCKNLATNEITSKDSTPIDATGTENVGVRVPQ